MTFGHAKVAGDKFRWASVGARHRHNMFDSNGIDTVVIDPETIGVKDLEEITRLGREHQGQGSVEDLSIGLYFSDCQRVSLAVCGPTQGFRSY